MILNNFKKCVASSGYNNSNGVTVRTFPNGDSYTISGRNSMSSSTGTYMTGLTGIYNFARIRPNSTTSYSPGSDGVEVVVGTGTTPVTTDDYTLANIVTLAQGTPVKTNVIENGAYKGFIISLPITNNTGSALTITEVGIMSYAYRSNGGSNTIPVLIERTLLDVPVTIEAGQTMAVNIALMY